MMQRDVTQGGAAGVQRSIRDLHDARAAERAMARHLAVVSHELKTPINGILGILGLLRATDLDAEQREMVDLMWDSAEAQSAMVMDLNAAARMDDGREALQLGSFDPVATLASVVGLLRPMAEAKGLVMPAALPAARLRFRGDARAFRQVMTNVVGNAVKFTEQGSIVVRARLAVDAGGDARLTVEVEDTGPGISPADQATVFERYARGANGARAEGSGLGLAISAGLLELMGGTITLRSELGIGSTFAIDLPLRNEKHELDQGSVEP